MAQVVPEIYEFSGFRLDAGKRVLLGVGGEAVAVMPKAFDTLLLLVRNAGRTVSKDEVFAEVWRGHVVEENNLTQNVSALRKLLGERPSEHRFIATVPGRGYLFVADVRRLEAVSFPPEPAQPEAGTKPADSAEGLAGGSLAAAGVVAPPSPRGRPRLLAGAAGLLTAAVLAGLYFGGRPRFDGHGSEAGRPTVDLSPSIAVLPFANLSPDPGQDYFSDGLSEELLTQLAHTPGLRVIGRTSSFAFKGKSEDLRTIGQLLGVDHILEGSVRREGHRVRVTAQLIDPADGRHLWSETYERDLGDVFVIQDEVARTVASALRISIAARIVARGGTRSFAAYDAFLAGREAALQGRTQNLLAGIAAFERAVAIDEGFAAAWWRLAGAYRQASIDVPEHRPEWLEKALRAENRVRALDANGPAASLMSAQRELADGNLAEAERLLASVKDLPPGDAAYLPYGVFLLTVGRPKEAIDLLLHARRAEPLLLAPSLWLQIAYEMAGDDERADTEYRRALGFVEDARIIRSTAVFRTMGRRDRAALAEELPAQIAAAPLLRPLHESMQRLLDDPPSALAELRMWLDRPNTLDSAVMVMSISNWAAYFDDPALALQAMRKLPPLAAGNDLRWAIWRPGAREMRRLPEFKALLRGWHLVDYWRATGKWGDYCRPKGREDFECE